MAMPRRTRAALALIVCSLALLLVIGGMGWLIPNRMAALQAILSQRDKLRAEREAETLHRDRLAELRRGAQDVADMLARRRKDLEMASFTPRTEAQIPAFVADLQIVFNVPGLRLVTMSYKPRTMTAGFVTLPFSARFEATFAAFHQVLASIETSKTALRIVGLELLSLNNAQGLIEFRIDANARFKAGA